MYDNVIEAIREYAQEVTGHTIGYTIDGDIDASIVEMPVTRLSTSLSNTKLENYEWQIQFAVKYDNHQSAYTFLESINKTFHNRLVMKSEQFKLSQFDVRIPPRRFATEADTIYYQTAMRCLLETKLITENNEVSK